MITSLKTTDLKNYIGKQLEHFFPDDFHFVGEDVEKALNLSLDRLEYCFRHISRAPYTNAGETYFSHLHSDQYSQFLYFLSNSLWKISQNKILCDKLIYLNKVLHGFFYSYKCELPDIFFFNHPVGSIIGNALYSDFLVISQNVTINTGDNVNGTLTPYIGKGVYLAAGSKIIGNFPIGNNVAIGVDAVVYKQEIPSNSIVYRDENGKIIVRPYLNGSMAQTFFNINIQGD